MTQLECKISPGGRNDKAVWGSEANLVVVPDDFEYAPVAQEGGLGKVHQIFGSELDTMIQELDGALAA